MEYLNVRVLPENILGTVVLIECKHSISEDDLIDDAKKEQDKLSKKNILKNRNLKNMKKQLAIYLSIKNSVM